MSAIVDIRELTRAVDGLVAVDHTTIAIEQAEIFGLIGPNGAGALRERSSASMQAAAPSIASPDGD